MTVLPAGKRYFQHTKLADIVGAYPMAAGLDDQAALEERQHRESFLDFLLGILDLDPACRYHLWKLPSEQTCETELRNTMFLSMAFS